ncbi:DUF3991 and toprim domain-containing protein [Chakrabartyella piscis]|uniref:DUF3991 and toprim domain-containing protein n=1 Tax=Chakrabartyella piscis TaxID=2918914 RepID=UPI00295854B1|nr:DUF3991 and toprim domain-containing protein [Chakrabartyella piscis]
MATSYIHFTEEQKERANSIDLEYFLQSKGEQLIRSGRDRRLKSDHSITIRGNTWYDHAKEKGGYAIDFVKMFYGLDFPSAVTELIGETGNNLSHRTYEKKEEAPKPFILPPRCATMKRAFAYLTKHRGIDPQVASFFAKEKLVYESEEISKDRTQKYNNLIFVGLDENGVPAHAHKRSIYSQGKKFMQNIEGSNPHHSFHYLGGSNRLYVFEAPIDMLSFITMYKDTNWKTHNYVAMCGTSSMPMTELLDRHDTIDHVVVCTDNDKTGHAVYERFKEMLSERGVASSRITPQTKDFNEDLLSQQANSEPTLTMEMRCV